MKKSTILILGLLLICLGLSGQTNLYFDLSGTYPFIPDSKKNITNKLPLPLNWWPINYKLHESYCSKPGIDMTLGFQRKLLKKVRIDMGMGISFVSFNRNTSVDFIESSQTITDDTFPIVEGKPLASMYQAMSDEDYPNDNQWTQDSLQYISRYTYSQTLTSPNNLGQTKILYLTIPVNIQYPLISDKFLIGIGVKTQIITLSRQIRIVENHFSEEFNDKSGFGLSNLMISGTIDLQYKLFKGFWIKTTYNHAFTPIYDKDQRIGEGAKFRTFNLGLRYYLKWNMPTANIGNDMKSTISENTYS